MREAKRWYNFFKGIIILFFLLYQVLSGIIVMATLLVNPLGPMKYITSEGQCFLSRLDIVYFVLVPLAATTVITLVLFILTTIRINKPLSRKSTNNEYNQKSNHSGLTNERRTVIVLIFSNGLTWSFGFLLAIPFVSNDNTTLFIFSIMFCLFNAFQGAYILFSSIGLRKIILKKQRNEKQQEQDQNANHSDNASNYYSIVYEDSVNLSKSDNYRLEKTSLNFRNSELNRMRPDSYIELSQQKIYLSID